MGKGENAGNPAVFSDHNLWQRVKDSDLSLEVQQEHFHVDANTPCQMFDFQ